MVLNYKMTRVLKVVALFEAFKGLLVLLAGVAIFSMMPQDIQASAEQLIRHLHLNPAHNIPRIFIEAAGHLTDSRLRFLALFALLYALMRFIEAYGLWFARRWAEWFALISGCVYLPVELFELAKGFTWLKIALVVINLMVVLYMAFVLKHNERAKLLEKNLKTLY
ncbi:MAG: DUF2127 domain-containing protein [Chlorobiaceae bacterium]|nr:DUF2127 domain-containing protein [Chlorobiaceae bacterium]